MRAFLIMLCLVLLVACNGTNLPPPGPPSVTTGWGVEVHPQDALSIDLARLRRAHVDVVRIDYCPADCGGDRIFDAFVPRANAAGLKVLFITPYVHINQVFDANAYAAVVARGAGRYPGQLWELMNEPDNDQPLGQQTLTMDQYLSLVRTAVPTIRSADPSAIIITGGTSGLDGAFLLNERPIYPLVDGVSIHPYGQNPNDFGSIAALGVQYAGKPVAFTEWGNDRLSDLTSAMNSSRGHAAIFIYENQAGYSGLLESEFAIFQNAAHS